MTRARHRLGCCTAALLLTASLTACLGATAPTAPPPAAGSGGATTPSAAGTPSTAAPSTAPSAAAGAARPTTGTALALAQRLVVKGRGAKTGYDRDLFGPAWSDTDRNGCDTRNDILARDLTAVRFRPGTRDCVVLGGSLAEPYTGVTMTFSKADASAVQIDHVVALSDAWQKGASGWAYGRRLAFANDPLNLLASDGPSNTRKGASDTASWLPPNRTYRCAYVARQVAVKAKFTIAVTPSEQEAMVRVLRTCPDLAAPTGGNPVDVVGAQAAPVQPRPGHGAPGASVDPDHGTCAAARANGAGPYTRAQAEYGYYRDGDGDGTVCER